MPLPNLAPEEYAEIVRLVRAAIDGDRYPLSARVRRLKSILAKLDLEAERPPAIILVAGLVAYHWRKGAGAVVVPVALIASYAVLRWQRDD
jgi:hypothetical protein